MRALAIFAPQGACRAPAAAVACAPRPRVTHLLGQPLRAAGSARLAGTGIAALERRRRPAPPAVRERAGPVHVNAVMSLVWVAAGAALGGVFLGLILAKAIQSYLKREFDPKAAHLENARLRAKVEELQQMVLKFEPMAYKNMRLRFTKGVNKSVILGLVDELLSRKDVNIWWLPDSVERIFYLNVMTLMLSVLDEMVEGMSINMAGHNVKLSLTYLDMEKEQEKVAAEKAAAAAATIRGQTLLPSA